LKSLTTTIRPEDDPFVEHYQTPVISSTRSSRLRIFRLPINRRSSLQSRGP
jgi:hypothetical protein